MLIRCVYISAFFLLPALALSAGELAPFEALLKPLNPPVPRSSTSGPLVRLNASFWAPQTFASHSGDTLRVRSEGPSAGLQLGGRGDLAEDITYELTYGLRFPENSTITLGNGQEERVALLIHCLDWGLGYRLGSPSGVELGFKVLVGAEWPVDMNGYVFTGQDAFFAPQLYCALPANGHWQWRFCGGVHMSKDFAPNNPGSTPQPKQSPLPAGSVSGGDATAFARIDLEYLWPSK